ncbi:MAG: translation elongation factor 4 [Candidatus Omnitrophota bacterium]|nr:translation elongation factor 4 [Candidatus Omnitrophota bacterium]MBU1928966.1 translation elongation factor 4 [Candidatus Omnitrophota bacterium]MBU2035723.1 translation elongation factor 4 [Candidatus Omnitrophota bacterium]MBU2222374.1 translation elongation factor 4 [Candidatus Omnitrophota bacterium]MBU2257624.1 translation elongation factor 4 [Candidatus Omnitrophota bacterium]
MDKSLIRNFSIIAHIDHGKSTLADRILEVTGALDNRHRQDQVLDDMDLERERGITIKASTVRLSYNALDGKEYVFNLIDTPGHVDFTYEVSKSLAACEGAVLIIDAAQGIEAQTVANYYLAMENNLAMIPVINKIDLTSIDIPKVKEQVITILGFKEEDIILASAKEGTGVKDILERIIHFVPEPPGEFNHPLKALVFDCRFDSFKGVVVFIRIMDGTITKKTSIKFMHSGQIYKIEELGVFKNLKYAETDSLSCGEVGYLTANIRDPREIVIGDTMTDVKNPCDNPLPGYRTLKPLVFCGIYPVNPADFPDLRDAMDKLKLSDASFVFEPENSQSFGLGFRCGFLGLLHMEIVQERLEREYGLNLILTVPNVVYRLKKRDGEIIDIDTPAKFSASQDADEYFEPYVKLLTIIPVDCIEPVCEMVKSRRGVFSSRKHLGVDRVELDFDIPLSEIIVDFYDRIKSLTRGYGSIDYEFKDYHPTKLVRLDVMFNGNICDAFSSLIPKEKSVFRAHALAGKLKELIPRQLFEVNIQVAIGSTILASEKVKAVGKHVTSKCYGGDITRKRKLWEGQKKGKKRLKQFGKVEIPQEAFLEVLKI